MKQLVIILFGLFFGWQQVCAQVALKFESFKQKVLPENSMYFSKAELSDNEQLSLTAIEKYIGLSAQEKVTVMSKVAKSWKESLIIVNYGSKMELWGWSTETGSTQLLDDWDLTPPQLPLMPVTNASRTSMHPWFFYVGGMLGGDNGKNVNFAFNTRLGFFLLVNKWDFATTFSTGSVGNASDESASTGWVNFGLMSRVHFPIKKFTIQPNIGASLQFGDSGTQASLSLGFMWFVGFGSIDVAVNIGNQFSTLGGYTAFPQMKSKK